MSEPGKVHAKFAAAFAAVGAIGKNQTNQHHRYAYRGIDDVLNALHGVLADQGLFYVPRAVSESYEEWSTSNNKRLQVARIGYEFVFYADDGSSLTVGPVIGQSADTDDKAPMQALSQAAKYALLQAFCIPTEEMADPDSSSTVDEQGGRVAPQPATEKGRVIAALNKAGVLDRFADYLESVYGVAKWESLTEEDRAQVVKGVTEGDVIAQLAKAGEAA